MSDHEPPFEGQQEHEESLTDEADERVRVAGAVEEIRIARADELERLVLEKEKTHRRIAFSQLAAYLLIFTVSLVGWGQIEQEAHARCEAGEANRQALRNIIVGVDNLGTQLVSNGKNPTTPEQEAVLTRFRDFRTQQLALIAGPVCP